MQTPEQNIYAWTQRLSQLYPGSVTESNLAAAQESINRLSQPASRMSVRSARSPQLLQSLGRKRNGRKIPALRQFDRIWTMFLQRGDNELPPPDIMLDAIDDGFLWTPLIRAALIASASNPNLRFDMLSAIIRRRNPAIFVSVEPLMLQGLEKMPELEQVAREADNRLALRRFQQFRSNELPLMASVRMARSPLR